MARQKPGARHARSLRLQLRQGLGTLALCAALLGPQAHAHEASGDAVPEQPGLQLGLAAAVAQAQSAEAWPAPRLPGVFTNGATPTDRRTLHLEHATLDLGLRTPAGLGAALVLGWHDADPVHVEAAWLQAERDMGDQHLRLGLGRNRVPMGLTLGYAGHFDRFATVPLAKRAVLGDDWIDDGLSLHLERPHDGPLPWLEAVDLGAWRARSYPGGRHGPPAAVLHLSGSVSHWQWDGVLASLQPRGRGGYTQGPTSVHTHVQPDCDSAQLSGVTCFDGSSQILGGSLSGDLPWGGLQLSIGGLLRRDQGLLYTGSGEADYRGSTGGGWLDLAWPLHPQLTLAARAETVRSVQKLQGSSAVLAARDAGLLGSVSIRRGTAALVYSPVANWRVALEYGSERQGAARQDFAALRLTWLPGPLWQQRW